MPDKVTEIFHGEPRQRVERNPLSERMERCAGVMAQTFADNLAGYIVIGVNHKGEWSIGHGVDPDSPVGGNMLAGLGLAAINRDMLAEAQIKDALVRCGLIRADP